MSRSRSRPSLDAGGNRQLERSFCLGAMGDAWVWGKYVTDRRAAVAPTTSIRPSYDTVARQLAKRLRRPLQRLVHDVHALEMARRPVVGQKFRRLPYPSHHEHPGDVVGPDPADHRPWDRPRRASLRRTSHRHHLRGRIAKNSGGAGNGGRKNQRSLRVMNSRRWPPATSCRNITDCSCAALVKVEHSAEVGWFSTQSRSTTARTTG